MSEAKELANTKEETAMSYQRCVLEQGTTGYKVAFEGIGDTTQPVVASTQRVVDALQEAATGAGIKVYSERAGYTVTLFGIQTLDDALKTIETVALK